MQGGGKNGDGIAFRPFTIHFSAIFFHRLSFACYFKGSPKRLTKINHAVSTSDVINEGGRRLALNSVT